MIQRNRCTALRLGLVLALALAAAAGAQVKGLYYQEVEQDGRVYVFNTPERYRTWQESGEMGVAITLVGQAEGGKTLIGENETAIDLYLFKHNLSAYERTTPPPAPSTAWTAKWDNGFKLDSPDGKFKMKWGGRVQADYTFASADDELELAFGPENFQDGFEFRRARLFVEGVIYDRVEFKIEYDFASGESEVKDTYIALLNEWGDVKFGHFKEPFSLETLTSSRFIAFVERSLTHDAFAPERNSGIGIAGGSDAWNWGLGAFYDADDFGTSVDENRINLTGRFAYRPIYADGGKRLLHLALAASSKDSGDTGVFRFRTRPEAHFTTRLVDTGEFTADSATLLGGELAGVFGPFWFAGEYMQSDVDAPEVGDPAFDGYYLQAGYFFTGESRGYKTSSGAFDRTKPANPLLEDGGMGAWEVLARLSNVDLSDEGVLGGEQENVTVGLNWYPNAATRLMLNYVLADVEDLGEADFILARWAVDF